MIPKPADESFLRGVVSSETSYSEGWREVCARLLWAEQRLRILELATPLNEDLSDRIDDMCKLIAMEQGYTLNGIARLLNDVQRRMAADWVEIGQLRHEVNTLRQEFGNWAAYCFMTHGNDARLYNALLELSGCPHDVDQASDAVDPQDGTSN